MFIIKRSMRIIAMIGFGSFIPMSTTGQQSILLNPDEQNPVLPSNLPPPPVSDTAPAPPPAAPAPAPAPQAQPGAPSPTPAPVAPVVKKSKKSAPVTLKSLGIKKTASSTSLNITASGAIDHHEAQDLKNPTRLVIDLYGVKISKKIKKTIALPNVGQVRLGAHSDHTRLVVDYGADQLTSYQIASQKNGLSVTFTAASVPPPTPVPVVVPIPPPPQAAVPAKPVVPVVVSPPDEFVDPDEVIVLKPVKKQDISKPIPMPSDQVITIDLRDADIRNVLRFIAQVSGYNIVAGDNVSGTVTIRLQNVPWREGLHAILQVKSLGYTEADGIIRVLRLEDLQKEQSSRLMNSQLAESNLPIVTRLLPVNYAAAQTLVPQIKEMLSLRGKVSVDERTNVLIVSDIQDNVEKVDRMIQTLDTQTPQVLIEARMVEANTTFSRSLGIQWGGSIFGGAGADNPTGIASTAGGVAGIMSGRNYAVNLPAVASTSGIGFALGTVGNMAVLNARLSAAENNGQAKTVSMPKIMTLDNKAAKITQGYEIPYTIYNLATVQTQFVNAALQLDVIPHVTADGAVQMSVKISQNFPDFDRRDNLGIPAIRIKEATTELLVKDGDTAVIGGIYTRSMVNNSGQVPLLGSIPVLGWLFKNSSKSDEQTEMLVFLTPRLMNRKKSTIDTSLVEQKGTEAIRYYGVP